MHEKLQLECFVPIQCYFAICYFRRRKIFDQGLLSFLPIAIGLLEWSSSTEIRILQNYWQSFCLLFLSNIWKTSAEVIVVRLKN